jgi:iron complex outermembrane receptor protein
MKINHRSRALMALAVLSQVSSIHAQQADHAAELEEVVVTASPIGDPDRLATISGSVNRDQLLRSGSNTIADALAQLPGVASSGFAAGAGRPVIRGMDANRVRMLEDGIGSFDVSDVGPDHGVPLDPLVAERVEVVRGAATLRYGSQAIGGVVNAISNRVPLHMAEATRAGEVTGGLGSVADSRDFSGQFNVRAGEWAMHADGFGRHADDYDTPLGPMTNSWLRGGGGALGGAWIGEDIRLGLGAVRHESRYGIPGEDAYIDMKQNKLSLRSSFDIDAGPWRKLTVDAGGADYEHSERDEDGVALATFKDDEWEARAEIVSGSWGFLSETAFGAQLQQRDFSALGEGANYLSPTRTRNRALFGFAESRLGQQLRIQFGARVESVEVAGTPASDLAMTREFTPVSASVGMVFDPGAQWRMGLALSSSARAPAQTELFARGAHEATATWEIGLPSMRLERAGSAELSLRWRGARVHADGALWITDFRNYIHGALTGRSCSEEGDCVMGAGRDLSELLYTQRGALFRGAEGHAEIELLQHAGGDLHLELLADMVRARLDDGAGPVPRLPPWRVGAGLRWQGTSLDVGVSVKRSGAQKRIGAQESPTAGFTNVDVQLAWRPWRRYPHIELGLWGHNLTDSLQRNAVALNKDEVVAPGRNIRLAFRLAVD